MTAMRTPVKVTVAVEYDDGKTEYHDVITGGEWVRHDIDTTHAKRDGVFITTTDHRISWQTVECESDQRIVWILDRLHA